MYNMRQMTSVIPTMKPETLRLINYYSTKLTNKVDNFLSKSSQFSRGEASNELANKSISSATK